MQINTSLMREATIAHKDWKPINLTEEHPRELLLKIIHVCTASLELRLSKSSDESYGLDLLCSSDDELKVAEARIHQALADEYLRERINSQCNTDVSALVDNILVRSSGGK